jgi:tRNA dimethylallyltransferase
MNCSPKKILIVVTGPTAIGKTSVSVRIASHFKTSIISADSRQFYHEMKIGTAAPTPEELAMVPHSFVGHLSINHYYNVSRFETEALKLLERLYEKNQFVVMTGGSGLYIDAVCKGIDELPDPDEKLRNETKRALQEKGIEYLQQQLQQLDPEYYAIVDKANPNRLMRAIEVCLATGNTFSSLRKNQPKPRDFIIIKIGLNRPRNELFENIALRTDKMMATGLVDEVKSLLPFRQLNALNTVGYKEIFDYLDGKTTLEQAITNIKTNTRRYAKRQLTWFKRDESIQWFLPGEVQQIISFIEDNVVANRESP